MKSTIVLPILLISMLLISCTDGDMSGKAFDILAQSDYQFVMTDLSGHADSGDVIKVISIMNMVLRRYFPPKCLMANTYS